MLLRGVGWIACVVYSTIPAFWLMIHPRARRWRKHSRSPYRVLLPVWVGMWVGVTAATAHWRSVTFYASGWSWLPAGILFVTGIFIYRQAGMHFSWSQLGGLPEVSPENHDQRLVTTGIRARVRHPIYLGHLCRMLAWSVGTGLVVCWALTGIAIVTGAVMIRAEDAELEARFGEEYRRYQFAVPAVLPKWNLSPSGNSLRGR